MRARAEHSRTRLVDTAHIHVEVTRASIWKRRRKRDKLVVEVQVLPQDVDQVAIGQKATVRFTAFNLRTTPEIEGVVIRLGADLSEDQRTGASFYVARVEFAASELARLGPVKLVPGMPAEAHIQTDSRSALSYLTKPLRDQIARAMRED